MCRRRVQGHDGERDEGAWNEVEQRRLAPDLEDGEPEGVGQEGEQQADDVPEDADGPVRVPAADGPAGGAGAL